MPPEPHPVHSLTPAFCLQMEGASKGVCSPALPTGIPQGHTLGKTSRTGECDLSCSQLTKLKDSLFRFSFRRKEKHL